MNVPVIAYNTFRQLKDVAEFGNVYKSVKRKLATITNSLAKVRFLHKEINTHMDEVFQNPVAKKLITCHRGCSACCHTQVSITQDEANMLANKIAGEYSEHMDFTLLYIQSKALNSGKDWLKIDYPLRRCVFLGSENECTIYKDRPMVCRTNNVFSDPKLCSTEDGSRQVIKLLNTHKADMTIMAGFETSTKNGAMANMIWETLQNMKLDNGLKKKHNILSILD